MSAEPMSRLYLAAFLALSACGGDSTSPLTVDAGDPICTIDLSQLLVGAARDGIPSLTNPAFVAAGDETTGYLLPTDRVIGFQFGGETLAIPHNILWWHEIINLDIQDAKIAITYCPLTGTAMAFDREPVNGAELGVSGLLFMSNLVMYDRSDEETLFSQIMGKGVCGLRRQTVLPRLAISEMTWEAWQGQFPNTNVVSGSTGYGRDYTQYPYGGYEQLDDPPFSPQEYDHSRQPKERIVGIEGPNGGFLAVPFLELDALGELAVVNVEVDGESLVVVWDRAGKSGNTFSRIPQGGGSGAPLTFTVEDGKVFDVETGSWWSLGGEVVEGPLEGASLGLYAESMTAFWFAWSAFHPDTQVWTQANSFGY